MDTQEIRDRIRTVLERSYLMSIGTYDAGGVWVCDVIVIHDDAFNLYWMSDPDARHSQALCVTPTMAATITVNGPREPNFGIQIAGVAEEIVGPRHDLAVKHYMKRKKPAPAPDDDALQGDRWYILRPSRIELIDEVHCGFVKQVLKLL